MSTVEGSGSHGIYKTEKETGGKCLHFLSTALGGDCRGSDFGRQSIISSWDVLPSGNALGIPGAPVYHEPDSQLADSHLIPVWSCPTEMPVS